MIYTCVLTTPLHPIVCVRKCVRSLPLIGHLLDITFAKIGRWKDGQPLSIFFSVIKLIIATSPNQLLVFN